MGGGRQVILEGFSTECEESGGIFRCYQKKEGAWEVKGQVMKTVGAECPPDACLCSGKYLLLPLTQASALGITSSNHFT